MKVRSASGVGLAWRPRRSEAILASAPDFLEIAPDLHVDEPDVALSEAYALRDRFPIAGRGLATSLATDAAPFALPARHTAFVAKWCRAARAAFYALPAGFSRVPDPRERAPSRWPRRSLVHGAETLSLGRFVSIPTRDSARVLARNAATLAAKLPCEIALANVAPALRVEQALDDVELLTAATEGSPASIALDLASLHANALATGRDAAALLSQLDVGRLRALRVSGVRDVGARALPDAASHVPDAVWSLLALARSRAPGAPVVLDVDRASTEEMRADLARARSVARERGASPLSERAGRITA